MELIDQYLQLWCEDSNCNCIPLTSDELNNGISKINIRETYISVKKQLRNENYIKINIRGDYELTNKGLSEWKSLPHNKINPFSSNSTGNEWIDFRNLLSYYIECAKLEEIPTHVFYGEKENIDYFVPKSLPIDWLKDLNNVQEGTELNISYNKDNEYIVNQFKSHCNEDDAIYIGYPIISYKSKAGNLIYSPIGVIPVNIKLNSSTLDINKLTNLTLVPDFFQAKINNKILSLFFHKFEESSFLKNISHTHHEDEYVGLFDLSRALNSIEKIFTRGNNKDEKLNPVMPSQILPTNLLRGEKVLCNTVVIYSEKDFKFTKVLIKELQHIKDNVSDQELDQTSLAYIYRNPILEKSKQDKKIGISFIESNYEQINSLEEALNNPCTKITGPPGTGKSQVATNIIANSIFYNESILFTSRNKKAVEAIRNRTETLFENFDSDLYLTEFCHDLSHEMKNPWYQKDINTSINNRIKKSVNQNKKNKLQRTLELLIYQKDILNKEDAARLAYYNSKSEDSLNKNTLLKLLLSEDEIIKLCDKDIETLDNSCNKLTRITNSFIYKFILKQKYKDIVNESFMNMKEILPTLFEVKYKDLAIDKIVLGVKEIINNYYIYKKSLEILKEKEKFLKNSIVDKSITDKIKQYYKTIDECKFDGYCNNMNERLLKYEENEDLLKAIHSLQAKYRNKDTVKVIENNSVEKTERDAILFNHFLKIHPSWAVTLLSVKYTSPCLAGVFDKVIIDEAAQCDCISIIPALYRSKSAIFMGDKQQLPPILNINSERNNYFWTKFNLDNLERFDYLQSSAYSVISNKEKMLKEHFRCAPEIVEIFSSYFYSNKLRTRTEIKKLKFPKNCGYKCAVEWIDVKNSFNDEIEVAFNHVLKLLDNKYSGTIGIISPLRKVVDTIQYKLDALKINPEKVISKTVASFQGSECDIIIFVVAYNSEILNSKGKKWYLTDNSNNYIYNVAISRAKALLLLVGDREACRNSTCKILEKLANSPKKEKEFYISDSPIFESPWEEKLYYELLKNNIETKTQVPLVGRRLDLAYISDQIKIDIEVDGVAYHTTSSGTIKMDDIFRDMQVEAAGWFVIRFWVFELQEDIKKCVDKVIKMIEMKGYIN